MKNLPKLRPLILHECTYCSPLGMLRIAEDDKGITIIDFCEETGERVPDDQSLYLKEAQRQLKEYFEGKRKDFDLPLSLYGTEFQKRVWMALRQIPYGTVRSYQDIAAAIGNRNSTRAVGMANNRNHIVIVIPCHRVIGKDGSLTGYGGGLEKKKYLLNLEGSRYQE